MTISTTTGLLITAWSESTLACLMCSNQLQAYSRMVFVRVPSFLETSRTSLPYEGLDTFFLWDARSHRVFSFCCSSNITGGINTRRKGLSGPYWPVLLWLTGALVTPSFPPHRTRPNLLFQAPNHPGIVRIQARELLKIVPLSVLYSIASKNHLLGFCAAAAASRTHF